MGGERKSIEPMAARMPEGNVQAFFPKQGKHPVGVSRQYSGGVDRGYQTEVENRGFQKRTAMKVGPGRSGTII